MILHQKGDCLMMLREPEFGKAYASPLPSLREENYNS